MAVEASRRVLIVATHAALERDAEAQRVAQVEAEERARSLRAEFDRLLAEQERVDAELRVARVAADNAASRSYTRAEQVVRFAERHADELQKTTALLRAGAA